MNSPTLFSLMTATDLFLTLSLSQLHNFVDACSEIVDRARKELGIEKQLKKIESTWGGLALTFSPYQDSDINQMSIDDLITESLENDNLLLQNMSGQKYVQANAMFLESVAKWQKNLGTVGSQRTARGLTPSMLTSRI